LSRSSETFDVRTPEFYDEINCNGTNIRMNIVMDKEWKDYVPDAVHSMISEVDGTRRIKVLFESQRDGAGEIRQYPEIK